jgi:hypothetical protein
VVAEAEPGVIVTEVTAAPLGELGGAPAGLSDFAAVADPAQPAFPTKTQKTAETTALKIKDLICRFSDTRIM